MNKTIKFIIAAILAAMAIFPAGGMEDPSSIPIICTNGRPGEAVGRSLEQQIFFAEYNDLLNCVVLTCVSPCGDVEVTLESTAGDWYQTVFDTLDGAILIPASGDSGNYALTIVASDGTTYEGEFYL